MVYDDRIMRMAGQNVPQRTTQRVNNQQDAQNQWDAQERYNKFQMRAGNEPGASARERDVTRGFMDAGYRSPEFTLICNKDSNRDKVENLDGLATGQEHL